MNNPLIHAADLFCGGGGTSTGLLKAARKAGLEVKLLALNHCQVAITTHELNHPGVQHLWADIQGIEPRQVVPGGRLQMLVASPECIFFSKARGGKPVNDQRRSSASYILTWVRQLDIEDLLIENVPEFEDWGPIHETCSCGAGIEATRHSRSCEFHKPIPELKGTLFQEFIGKLRRRGYHVEWRVICCADYGDATTRERLFIRARLGSRPIVWPTPTHQRAQWRAAREIIDFSVMGTSIYARKKPLAINTMKRILAGVWKFSGLAPFIIGQQSGAAPRHIDKPLPTISADGAIGLASPCLVEYHGDHRGRSDGDGRVRSIDEPLRTLDTSNRFGLAQPYLINVAHSKESDLRMYPIDDPLRTINGHGEFGLVQPCLTVLRNHADGLPIDGPLPAICAKGQHVGMSVPFLVNMKGKSTAVNIDAPLPTQTAHAQHLAMAYPFLTEYYGTGGAESIDEPLNTVTTRDRFALNQPALLEYAAGGNSHLLKAIEASDPLYRPQVAEIDGALYLVDILYRMLMVKELAAATGFPADYLFMGTQEDQVRLVGNAVPVETATALCSSMLM
ncbi:MAG: DNA cytosine methyltransferase [Armatimonadota bacterium]